MSKHTRSFTDQIIVAQCTPKGQGALALLRFSGDGVFALAQTFVALKSKKMLCDTASHTIHYGTIIDTHGAPVDHVLFFVMHGPHTFTGEDVLEITCHNNPFIIQQIIELAIAQGARHAAPGEFAQRAVLHDKMDLLQAEAINELIHANTQFALKKALAQTDGTFSAYIHQIERQLLHCLALCQASFEFIEEEGLEFGSQVGKILESVLTTIVELKATFAIQEQIRTGIRIALIGTVNAGKSSLFNAIIGKERAIVSAVAGTTRDSIEAGLYINTNYWTLIDTAGLRSTKNMIEKEGITRSFAEAHNADIILLVTDSSVAHTPETAAIYEQLQTQYAEKIIPVISKTDLASMDQEHDPHALLFSLFADRTAAVEQIIAAIEQKILALVGTANAPFLLNKRQYNILLDLEKKILTLLPLFADDHVAYELRASDLQQLLVECGQLTGKTISEQAMDAVFTTFCVGK